MSLYAKRALVLLISSCITTVVFSAVTEWSFVKGRGGEQIFDDQGPSAKWWDVEIYLAVESAADAASVSISGGGIVGSLPFSLDGSEWVLEKDYQSEAAMDAAFPNNTNYTITLSGGSLGTLEQTVSVGAKDYPSIPYLTGTGVSTLKRFDPTGSFDFEFATPSGTPDLTIVELEDGSSSPFDLEVVGSQTTLAMPADTLEMGKVYEGYADHVNLSPVSGAGGFGVDGNVAHSSFVRFEVDTASANSIIGAWAFGDGAMEGSGVVMFMKDLNYFHIEDVGGSDPGPDGYEMGTYAWNEQTGSFSAAQTLDRNGETGLSHPNGLTTVSVSGDTLTYTDSEGSSILTRVRSDSNPLVGAWQYGESSPLDSRALVILPNGIYFEAQNFGQLKGMEKGRYLWEEGTGLFEAEILVDTEVSLAFSDQVDEFEIRIQADELLIVDEDREWRLYSVAPTTVGFPVPAVTDWHFVKSRAHFQNTNDEPPPATAWSVKVALATKMNQDALTVEMRVAGRPGGYPLVQDSARGWTFSKYYQSEVAMNEEFPAGAKITIELSGGNLGTMSQAFTLMTDEYPNTPYLTGSRFTDGQRFDSFLDFGLTWSNPGPLTENSGRTILEVFRFYNDETVYRDEMIGATLQGTVPSGTVFPGHTFYGLLEYTHTRSIDGIGGFGVNGTEARNAATDFNLGTLNSPLAGAWSFGDSSGDNSGVLVFLNNGTFFHIEDVGGSGSDPDGFERGEYVWDRSSGAFEFEVLTDTNGTVGLSDSGDTQTIVLSGDSLTFSDDGEQEVLSKVTSGSDELIGGWQWGDGGEEFGGVYVFLENGYYFGLVYNEPLGLALDAGIERGSYTYQEVDLIPVLTANAILDTNGEKGLSHVEGEWTSDIFGDTFSFSDNRGGEFLVNAETADVRNRMRVSDPRLDAAFRETSGKLSGHLLRLDMQRILKMDASGRGIVEVEGFSEAYNLQSLDLSNNEIEDLWQVGDLLNLFELDLSGNRISDISYLSRLTKLIELDLSDNLLSDPELANDSATDAISVFSDLKPTSTTGILGSLQSIQTLEILDIAGNEIRDLSVLTNLSALKEVDLSGNQVGDLTPLGQLAFLEKVSLYNNPVDLSEGSNQLALLNSISQNTGALLVLEAPDPLTRLVWDWNDTEQRYELVWSVSGVLQFSSDFEMWQDIGNAQSPYPVDFSSASSQFWRLEL